MMKMTKVLLGTGAIGLAAVAFGSGDPATTPTTPAQKPAETAKNDDAKPSAKPEAAKPEGTPAAKVEPKQGGKSEADVAKPEPYVLGHTVKTIEGVETKLESFKGKVVLIVNVATKCGYTPQYAGLEKLYKGKADSGFVILGFPANNFGGQEPGTNKEIAEFCKATYEVTFPMFEKISVKGDDAHPLYKQIAALQGEPKWNFTKYLVDRKGNLVARYESRVKPDDAEMNKRIEELLAQK
jgi:glutathione peroxidase